MVYDRSSRGGYGRDPDYSRNHGGGRDYSYSSARDYQATQGQDYDRGGRGGWDRDDDRSRAYGDRYRGGGGWQEQGGRGYDRGDRPQAGYGGGRDRSDYGARDYGHAAYGERGRFEAGRDKADYYRVGERGGYDGDRGRDGGRAGYGRQPQGYEYEDRGFFDRAGDEVRSWFGDEEAERRRELDQRYDERDERSGRGSRDHDYHSWRSSQMAALDRDYHDYRRENSARFEQEFASWRTNRQGQRDSLGKVKEHQEVVGSDGSHVGTVDKVKGDRILLTKNDEDAGGQHHSIPSSWITSVDDKVTLNKSADEAKRLWQDEDGKSATFGYGDNARVGDARGGQARRGDTSGGHDHDEASGSRNLNRSFSGTY